MPERQRRFPQRATGVDVDRLQSLGLDEHAAAADSDQRRARRAEPAAGCVKPQQVQRRADEAVFRTRRCRPRRPRRGTSRPNREADRRGRPAASRRPVARRPFRVDCPPTACRTPHAPPPAPASTRSRRTAAAAAKSRRATFRSARVGRALRDRLCAASSLPTRSSWPNTAAAGTTAARPHGRWPASRTAGAMQPLAEFSGSVGIPANDGTYENAGGSVKQATGCGHGAYPSSQDYHRSVQYFSWLCFFRGTSDCKKVRKATRLTGFLLNEEEMSSKTPRILCFSISMIAKNRHGSGATRWFCARNARRKAGKISSILNRRIKPTKYARRDISITEMDAL